MKSKLQTEIDKMEDELVLRLNEVNKYSKTLNAGEQAYKNGRIDQLRQVIEQLSIVTESEILNKKEEQKSDGIISSIIDSVTIPKGVEGDWWYKELVGETFKIKDAVFKSDIMNCGVGGRQPEELFIITEGDYKGNAILKSHCL